MEEDVKSKAEEEGIEEKILRAIRARVSDFKERADSITLENVRRTLEKDLEMNAFALDSHKRFIKQRLEECFNGAEETTISKDSGENFESAIHFESQKPGKQVGVMVQHKEQKDQASAVDEKVELMEGIGDDTITQETKEAPAKSDVDLTDETIKKAIKRRSSYFGANSEKISLVGVRRLLEEDLKLEKNTLDVYKKVINKYLDEILRPHEVVKHVSSVRKHSVKGTPTKLKQSAEANNSEPSEASSDSSVSRSEDEEIDEKESKSKKRPAEGVRKNGLLKKQKRSAKVSEPSFSRKMKSAEQVAERTSEAEDAGISSDDAHSHSSEEETIKKKKSTPAQAYGKRVEHLKSVIKSCGMGVPPSVYKKVKQAPESKRETYLLKELEEILSREGLSTDPSEKEIKALRKRKERAKELEGIDLSNIVSSTRRRTTCSFVVSPKPKVPSESDVAAAADEAEDEEEEEDEDSDEGNNDSGVSSEENDEDVDADEETE